MRFLLVATFLAACYAQVYTVQQFIDTFSPVPTAQYLISKNNKNLLVDTGFTGSTLAAILAAVPNSQKIDGIFITHGHPDHVGGLAGLYALTPSSFPARIGVAGVATETVQDIQGVIQAGFYTLQQATFNYIGNMTVATSADLNTLFGVTNEITVRCMNPSAETQFYCDLYVAPNNALFTGDSVFGRAHMYTGGDVDATRFCGWQQYLATVCGDSTFSKSTTVYPGHGIIATGVGSVPNWYTVAAENQQYLTYAQNLYLNSCNVTTATNALIAKFPSFAYPAALGLVVPQQVPFGAMALGCNCTTGVGLCTGNASPACSYRADTTCQQRANSGAGSTVTNITLLSLLVALSFISPRS